MPTKLWLACRGARHVVSRRFDTWRAVEGQHVISTRKLCDSAAEQEILEQLIDSAKPALPPGEKLGRLHYLLFTPFRYPPLPWGSRFSTRIERGVWYGAAQRRTTFAERAYYRLLFLAGSAADLSPLLTQETVFRVPVRAKSFVDLTKAPFLAHERSVSSPTSYAVSQQLGSDMRAAGVEACAYSSARDRQQGTCYAVFEPVFGSREPQSPENWACTSSRAAVEFRSRIIGEIYVFPRTDFEVQGKLPTPAA